MSPREPKETRERFREALIRHGMNQEQAESAAEVFLDAELIGKTSHGAFHLLDYLKALDDGRINGSAQPRVSYEGAIISVDADDGLAQFAFDEALELVRDTADSLGVAVLKIFNTYTTGELGWYPRKLADLGYVSFVATNSPPLITLTDSAERVVGTNPTAFGVPETMVMDQASSTSAYVHVRREAEKGASIPEGWAVDKHGRETTEAAAAVDGAMLPFGGHKGGNVALMAEALAMIAGGNSSLEATGERPKVGLFAFVLKADASRVHEHFEHLKEKGVYIPGQRKRKEYADIDDELWERLLG